MLKDAQRENEIQHRLSLFEEKFSKGSRRNCWNWSAAKTKNGTGIFNLGPLSPVTSNSAAAASWFFYKDRSFTFESRARCVHLCGNKACVNPHHLAIASGDDIPSHVSVLEYLAMRHKGASALLRKAIVVISKEEA